MYKVNNLQNNYLIRPYQVGKDKRSLAMVLPSDIVKALGIDPLSIFLLLKVKGIDDLQIQIIREEDLVKKDRDIIPAEKVPRLAQQASSSSSVTRGND